MKLRFQQLSKHLQQESVLAPIYLISGDEPYQFNESACLIRKKVQANGFHNREIFDPEDSFNWQNFIANTSTLSLFNTRTLIELRLNSVKITQAGSQALLQYCAQSHPEHFLLILVSKREQLDLQSAWMKAIDKIGVIIQVWPFSVEELRLWIQQRLESYGFILKPEALELLTERAEGNLLAAEQEIKKICLLFKQGTVNITDLLDNLADNAHFEIFALTEAVLAGERVRALRILNKLKAEGTAEALVLWVLARDLRMLAIISDAITRRINLDSLFITHHVSRLRQPLIEGAVQRIPVTVIYQLLAQCLQIDRMIKGLISEDPWLAFAMLIDSLSTKNFIKIK